MPRPAALLFDLDGTVVDSAPDLAGAANEMRAHRGLAPVPFAQLRPMGGSGARGMLAVAFEVRPGDAGYEDLKAEFLERYQARLLRETVVFEAMIPVLQALAARAIPWGIVTNKSSHLARALVEGLPLPYAPQALVGGDTTPHTKPHPAPLLEGARQLGVAAPSCVYVGDDPRDMHAGRAAGMATVAAAWGYLGTAEPLHQWPADHVALEPSFLLNWLDLA